MDIEKVLHMKEGIGETSYENNSLLQRKVIIEARSILEESIRELYQALHSECLMVADMGCSTGSNTLLAVSEIIDTISTTCRILNRPTMPEFGVFLNDLSGNDFNTLFKTLPNLYKIVGEDKEKHCFVSGTPGSFYGRVFPSKFIHFVHSSYSLHWLSQVPKGLTTEKGEALNKRNIHIARTSPPEVSEAYYSQFKADFTMFLRSRAKEMVAGGRMALTFQYGLKRDVPYAIFELLGSTIHTMVLESLVEEKKLDNFNMPYYTPTVDEVRQLVKDEGSFSLDVIKTFAIDWSGDNTSHPQSIENRADLTARTIRAITESLLPKALGIDDATMDDLFFRFKIRVMEAMAKERTDFLNVTLSMTKLDSV